VVVDGTQDGERALRVTPGRGVCETQLDVARYELPLRHGLDGVELLVNLVETAADKGTQGTHAEMGLVSDKRCTHIHTHTACARAC
jgi:hypothetical protein